MASTRLTPEGARLEAVARYSVLDTPPEAAFSRLALLAAQFFRAPVAFVNIVADNFSWSKACVGVDVTRLDRQVSFCARTIEGQGALVALDLARDPRFVGNPLAHAPGGFRFYAGAPLRTPDGHNVGTLCVLDHAPRGAFSPQEEEALMNLAAMAVDELELRLARLEAEREALARGRLVDDLRRAKAYAETLAAVSALADLDLDPEDLVRAATELVAETIGLDWAGLVAERADGERRVVTAWRRPGLEGALPADTELVGASGTVVAPLGTYADERLALAARRAASGPWSHADRELWGVTARTLGGALLRREREERVLHEARHDPLTGLGNRRALDAALEGTPPPSAVAVFDLDGFKTVNDREGHARGDALLRLFAGALAAELPPEATLYRAGGDEFVVVLPGDADADLARADMLDHLDAAVAAVRAAGFREIGASFGVASWPGDAPTAGAALALADGRMYADKRRPGLVPGTVAGATSTVPFAPVS